jgi:hypothetical protein
MAALSLFTPRSERMMMFTPAAIERLACAQISSSAFSRPDGALPSG